MGDVRCSERRRRADFVVCGDGRRRAGAFEGWATGIARTQRARRQRTEMLCRDFCSSFSPPPLSPSLEIRSRMMRSAAALARRSQASRAPDFSNLCWTCLLAQRRQLSTTSSPPKSSPRSSRAIRYTFVDIPPHGIKEEPRNLKSPEKPRKALPKKNTAIEEYHKDEKQLLAQVIDQHRRQANEHQAALNRLARSSIHDAPGSRRSFHTSCRVSLCKSPKLISSLFLTDF